MANQATGTVQLNEEDWASVILADHKRIVREYATAATECVNQELRQEFTNLMNATLQMQGELYNAMQSSNMYNASSPAIKPEVAKQLQQYQQTQQKTQQWMQTSQAQWQPIGAGR